MKQTLLDLFTSKKFLAALSAVIIYLGGRFGFAVDPATLDRIFAAFLVYVGAQGLADHGKSAALVQTAAAARRDAIAGGSSYRLMANAVDAAAAGVSPLSKVSGTLLVLLMLTCGAAMIPACAHLPSAGDVKVAARDCAKEDAGAIAAVTAKLGAQAVMLGLAGQAIDWDALLGAAWNEAKVVGVCAGKKLLVAMRDNKPTATTPTPQGLFAAPDPAAELDAAIARLESREGVTVR